MAGYKELLKQLELEFDDCVKCNEGQNAMLSDIIRENKKLKEESKKLKRENYNLRKILKSVVRND